MIRVLRADIQHLPWLRRLYKELIIEGDQQYPHIDELEVDNLTLLAAQYMKAPEIGVFVAQVGKRIVAFTVVEVVHRIVGKPHDFGLIHWFYVTPKHRHRGVAKQLMINVAEWLEEAGCTTTEISTPNPFLNLKDMLSQHKVA